MILAFCMGWYDFLHVKNNRAGTSGDFVRCKCIIRLEYYCTCNVWQKPKCKLSIYLCTYCSYRIVANILLYTCGYVGVGIT